MLKTKQLIVIAIAAVMLFSTIGLVYATQAVPTPQGFQRVVVFIAAGKFQTPTGTPQFLANFYMTVVMGRTPAQIEQVRQAAISYFNTQFGNLSWNPVAFGADPKFQYRAYYISGMNVPPEGWVVRDGGFMATVGNDGSGGMKLFGTYGGAAGKFVPAGSFIVFGDYNIAVTNGDDKITSTIIIHYQSTEPILPDPINHVTTFRCTLIAPWGVGIAQGLSDTQTTPDGFTQANIRNVQTYPAFGPSITQP